MALFTATQTDLEVKLHQSAVPPAARDHRVASAALVRQPGLHDASLTWQTFTQRLEVTVRPAMSAERVVALSRPRCSGQRGCCPSAGALT